MKSIEKLRDISKRFSLCGIEAAGKEAEILVRSALDINNLELYRDDPELGNEQAAAVEEMAGRRSKREPLQYILGYNDFLGLKLLVGRGVLVPRPETELMAEHAISLIRREFAEKGGLDDTDHRGRMTVLDLCTGSGCLALSLAEEFPGALVYGVDISGTAISYAKKNAGINGTENVSFIKGHLFGPVEQDRVFDFIISNPPYISTGEIQNLQPEIKDWEPLNALDGGPDGLDFYREIIPASRKFLRENGMLMLELGAGCAGDVAGMLEDAGYTEVEALKDYAGIKRIIQAKWTK